MNSEPLWSHQLETEVFLRQSGNRKYVPEAYRFARHIRREGSSPKTSGVVY